MFDRELILGGEACCWSEYIESNSIHNKIWPSVAGVAERLWTEAREDKDNIFRKLDRFIGYLHNAGVGSRHYSYFEDMMKDLSAPYDHRPLAILASLFITENRVHTDGYDTMKPLTDLIDAVQPDSWTSWKFTRLVTEMTKSQEKYISYKGIVRLILEEWRDNHQKLKPLFDEERNELGKDISPAVHFSPRLKDLASCALNHMDWLERIEDSKPNCKSALDNANNGYKKVKMVINEGMNVIFSRERF
eukprot:TRINITY_DN5034_c0_g1_i1.p1 TRINITY_DN5034_c0_g1~~TRINITY_DN5034_c0_g1_i1.p1  ORF type:complete len:259 (-),score=44.24 TRINITY_DN5034_c0_g1_i1:24-764(-)